MTLRLYSVKNQQYSVCENKNRFIFGFYKTAVRKHATKKWKTENGKGKKTVSQTLKLSGFICIFRFDAFFRFGVFFKQKTTYFFLTKSCFSSKFLSPVQLFNIGPRQW